MTRGSRQAGFTIVETMIVLAITGSLFLSAAIMLTGRQAKTQFAQGYRDMETIIQQNMSEVSSGYYPSMHNIDCERTGPGGGPAITSSSNPQDIQGTNKHCIHLGRIMHFAVADDNGSPSDPQVYNSYTLVGVRVLNETDGNEGLILAKPRVMARAPGDPASMPDDMYISKKLLYGMEVVDMYHGTDITDPSKKIGAVGFTSNLGNLGGADVSQQVNVIAIPNTGINRTKSATVGSINSNIVDGIINPQGGVHICFKSGGTNQSVLMSIGGYGRQTNVTTQIKNSGDCR